MDWQTALEAAIRERDDAEAAFLQADRDYCDLAIYRLQTAEERIRIVIRQARAAMGYDRNMLPGRMMLTFPVALVPAPESSDVSGRLE